MNKHFWKQAKVTFAQPPPAARIIIALALALTLPFQLNAAGPAPVNLGTTANFVILSGAAITTTGGGIINGNIGASPIAGSAIGVSCAQVNGIIYAVDPSGPPCAVVDATLLSSAKSDLTTAYDDAAGRTPVPTGPFLNPNGGNIGGLNLVPGLYKFTTTAYITGADVTLTGGPNDVWIFQCAQDLQVGSGVHVILAGGAQAGNIYWQVGTSAVLGTFSSFSGTILASQAITMDTSSTLVGRALAFSAGVAFNGTGAAAPIAAVPDLGVQQPAGTNLVNGVGTNSFGSVMAGANSSLTFTITNSGTAALTVLGLSINGPDSGAFNVTAFPINPVSPGGSSTFTLSFAPVGAGVATATLQIMSNDTNNSPFNIALTGTGTGTNTVAGPAPQIVVQQPAGTNLVNGAGTNNFGSVAVGASTNVTFIITNTGAANLTILGLTVDGPDAALFSVTTNPAAMVSPSGSTTFTVRFAPIGAGVETAALYIASNDTNHNPFNIAVTGTGTNIATNILTNAVVIATSPIALDPQTGLFTNSVMVMNGSPNAVAAVRLYIMGLPADVTVYDASGSSNGTPYAQSNFPLADGGTIDFTLEYYRASRVAFQSPAYAPQFLANATTLTVTNGAGVRVAVFTLSNREMLLGFYTTPGSRYAVQYSTNLTVWLTADPFITAPANYVQWIDSGPPKTASLSALRYYRVLQLP